MFHSVIIATSGRPQVVAETVQSLLRQETPPDQIIVSASDPADVTADLAGVERVKILLGPRGSTIQRNLGIKNLSPDSEIVSFFDDDVELSPDYLRQTQRFLGEHPEVVGIEGRVVANQPMPREEARRRLAEAASLAQAASLAEAAKSCGQGFRLTRSLFGCNMNVRRHVLQSEVFDERLVLYAWMEDSDFSARVARHGSIGLYEGCRLVHLGAAGGRDSDVKVGFAQVMNPYYLYRKGVFCTLGDVLRRWVKMTGANLWLSLLGSASQRRYRRRKLRGNLIALAMIARGRIEPEAMARL